MLLFFPQWELPGAMGQQGFPKGDRDAQQPEGGLHGGCTVFLFPSSTVTRVWSWKWEEGHLIGRENDLGVRSVFWAFWRDSEQTGVRGKGVVFPEEAIREVDLPLSTSSSFFLVRVHTENTYRALCKQADPFQQQCLHELGIAAILIYQLIHWLTWVSFLGSDFLKTSLNVSHTHKRPSKNIDCLGKLYILNIIKS